MIARLRSLGQGVVSLFSGMGVTGRHLFRTPVTRRYPREKPRMSAAYRGVIAFKRFEETGTHDCIACDICAKICPSNCILVEGLKHPGTKGKRCTRFEVDFALCSLCGLCVDACPTQTLAYSKIYDHVGRHRNGFVYDLVAPYRASEEAYLEARRAEAEAAKRKKEKGEEETK